MKAVTKTKAITINVEFNSEYLYSNHSDSEHSDEDQDNMTTAIEIADFRENSNVRVFEEEREPLPLRVSPKLDLRTHGVKISGSFCRLDFA